MPAYRNKDNGSWYIVTSYMDWRGDKKQKCKRGFKTRREALQWEREYLLEAKSDPDMPFPTFVAIYKKDMKPQLKLNTWITKEAIIDTKILPYFAKRRLNDITPKDIIHWQNEMRSLTDSNGEPLSSTYLKTIHNQMSAIFNHGVKFYGLKLNPAAKAGSMGEKEAHEMLFWTKQEFLKFIDTMMDTPVYYYAFEMLYWCGIRLGEMLALTPADFDFQKNTVSITKSYQRIHGEDVITSPKTRKSIRVVQMPLFLSEEMQDYISRLYGAEADTRIFPLSKSSLTRAMARGSQQAGVKKIRLHDLRHSHVSLLIDMGFSALAIADRVGHESIDITYRYAHLFPSTQSEMAKQLNDQRMENEQNVS